MHPLNTVKGAITTGFVLAVIIGISLSVWNGLGIAFHPVRIDRWLHIISGVMNPLQTLLGVMRSRPAPSRTLMFPSLEAVYRRAYMRRPTSTMSARSESSALMRYARDTYRSSCRNRNRGAAGPR